MTVRLAPFEQRAMERDIQQEARMSVITALEVHFGSVPEAIQDAINQIKSQRRLHNLLRRALTVSTLEEFQHELNP